MVELDIPRSDTTTQHGQAGICAAFRQQMRKHELLQLELRLPCLFAGIGSELCKGIVLRPVEACDME